MRNQVLLEGSRLRTCFVGFAMWLVSMTDSIGQPVGKTIEQWLRETAPAGAQCERVGDNHPGRYCKVENPNVFILWLYYYYPPGGNLYGASLFARDKVLFDLHLPRVIKYLSGFGLPGNLLTDCVDQIRKGH